MKNGKAHTEHFTAFEEVSYICSWKVLTNRAVAMLVNRAFVNFVFCVVNVAHTLPCKQLSVSCVTAWHYTVKNVNASCDSLKNVYGSTYTHKVSRFVFRCIRLNRFDDFIHFFRRFSDSKTADWIAGKVKVCNFFHMINTQVIVNAALIYAEEHLLTVECIFKRVKTVHFCYTSFKPACCTLNAFLCIVIRRWVFYTLVKSHCYSRAEVWLNTHTFFGSHKNFSAVNMRVEVNALFFNIS